MCACPPEVLKGHEQDRGDGKDAAGKAAGDVHIERFEQSREVERCKREDEAHARREGRHLRGQLAERERHHLRPVTEDVEYHLVETQRLAGPFEKAVAGRVALSKPCVFDPVRVQTQCHTCMYYIRLVCHPVHDFEFE